jgi:uncharacterized SAM-binding protein YcdF (DUF218 family)
LRRTEHGGIFFRLLFLLVFLGFLAFLYVIRHPLMRMSGQLWIVDEPAEHADAIIVLSDDNYAGDRAFHAADLYRMRVAPLVVVSGRMLRPYAGMGEIIERDLESHGVPMESIVKVSHRAANTREEAEVLKGLVANRGWHRILIVTSNYHTRRTRFIFNRIFPSNVTVRVSAAHDSEFDPSSWWETRLGTKLFFNELVGYVVAWWELRSKSPADAGAILPIPILVHPRF